MNRSPREAISPIESVLLFNSLSALFIRRYFIKYLIGFSLIVRLKHLNASLSPRSEEDAISERVISSLEWACMKASIFSILMLSRSFDADDEKAMFFSVSNNYPSLFFHICRFYYNIWRETFCLK